MDIESRVNDDDLATGNHVCLRSTRGPRVNGVRIDPVNADGFLDVVDNFLGCGRRTGNAHVVHFCAAHPTVEARRDPEYRDLLNGGDLNVADGMPVAWAARRRGHPTLRLAGTDGMEALSIWGTPRELRHYLYGATERTLAAMQANLEHRHPGIQIVGTESPPFRAIADEELDETVTKIRAAGADTVWIGMGAPKQDVMGARLRERGAAPLLFAVGAAFDFIAETKDRAPEWMQRNGLEWVYRLGSEPGRLWKRYLVGNAQFVVGVAEDRLRGRT
jgi:N-acetylglucosaminyldiphosphoundecaprenol N-acetyl-beta-D-mannosaminyltransferase